MLHDRVEEQESLQDDYKLKPSALASLSGPEGPLELFKSTIETIIAKLTPQAGFRRLAQSFTWPFNKKEITEHFVTIERFKSHFTLVLQNDLIALSKLANEKIGQISKHVQDLNNSRRDQESEKVLSWLSPMSFHTKQTDVLQSVQQGTGKWLLESDNFRAWVRGDIELLWCPGIPGAGKTRLVSLVVDLLENRDSSSTTPTAYFYCEYGQREIQSIVALLSSLLEQLLRQTARAGLPQDVVSLYNKHTQKNTRPTLEQICDIFKREFSGHDFIHVVIDALDECTLSDELAIELVETVRKLCTNIRLLITSRPSTTFEDYFEPMKRIKITAHDQDIRLYLEQQSLAQPRLARHIRADPSLQEDIIRTITEGSRGMFLLAALHLESLSRKITRRDVRSSLMTLPETLDATYMQAIARIRTQAEEDVELAETIIHWVLCARQPLSVFELQHMYALRMLLQDEHEVIELEDDDLPPRETVTGVCGGLIVIDAMSNSVRLVHYTAQDYLRRTHQDSLSQRQLELTEISVHYLGLAEFSDGPAMSDADMADRLTRFPFLNYAANYWGVEIDEVQSENFWKPFNRFLSNQVAVSVANQVWSLPHHRYVRWSQEYPANIPALVLASSFELPDVLHKLVEQGHSIEGCGSDGETPLIRAARLGHAGNVATLIRLGANVAAIDVAGETAIERAASIGNSAAVKALLEGGAEANTTDHTVGWTVLMSAVASGNFETVRILVESGANLTAETKWGESALSLATLSGQEPIASLLADAGAILKLNKAGRRASVQANRKGLQALVKRLTTFRDPDYASVADAGLQREGNAVGNQLALIAELEEEASTSHREQANQESQVGTMDDLVDLGVDLEGLSYKRGFIRRYDIVKEIGKGNFAEVWLCRNKITQLLYAVKTFDFTTEADKRSRKRVESARAEILSLQKLRHPSIIGHIDSLVSDNMDFLYLVMELGEGVELFHHILLRQKLSETETRGIFRQIFGALNYIRQEGWAHRDIKPENILINNNVIKIVDFGLAIKLKDMARESDSTLCGTPSYVAPEILVQNRMYSYGVDIWSAGVVLYICLCGFPPFSDELYSTEFPFTLSQQIMSGRFDYPSPYWDSVGDEALDLIDSMLLVDPERRLKAEDCLGDRWILMPNES
ncbi:Pkinase-domain-containing protein [Colletotrichum eremochloae]|nr:Pkinase-domain-containing protein [Colletotrichum eremochloae]